MQIIKIPAINGFGRTEGCKTSGNAVLNALKEIYSNEQGKIIDASLLDLEEIHLDNSNLQEVNHLIYKNSLEALDKDKILFLGGDHSISFSVGRAFLEYCKKEGKEPCLIVFDSHPDLMNVIDKDFPTHEEWLRGLIERGFPSESIMLVGVRNSDKEEIIYLKEKKIRVISMNQLLLNIEDICDTIMEFSNGKELYLSIDIDVVDPAFAPGTGYKEPGGLTSRQILYLIQRMNKMKNLKAIDIVEINPKLDSNEITVKLGAKILGEFL